ncbi:MAG: hypothetical protein AB8B55_21940 [Mariniblastus sp.]
MKPANIPPKCSMPVQHEKVQTAPQYLVSASTPQQSITTGLTVSIALLAINLTLFGLLFALTGLDVGFQFLFGFEASVADEKSGGFFYAIGCFLVFVLRLAYLPSISLMGLAGIVFAGRTMALQGGQSLGAKFPAGGILFLHIVCLTPSVVFVIRTCFFLAK